MKRSALKRKTPLRRASKHRAKQLRAYAILKPIFLRAHPYCEAFPTCCNRSTEIHHVRGRVNELLTDERYLIGICSEHHAWIHSNANHARKIGLLV